MIRLEVLLQVGLALQGEREIGRLLERTAQSLLATLDVDRCGIFLRGESGPSVVLSQDAGGGKSMPFSRTLLGRAMERGEALANLAGTAIENSLLIEEVRKETVERMTLSRFLSPAVAEEVRRLGMSDGLRGERREITILFTDIRQFTSLSETLPPDELLEALNRAFAAMISSVLAQDGTVDKLTGDGLLAFFGAPIPQEDHVARALRAACAIREACRGLVTRSGRPLPVGIGLATGDATVGPVGTDQRREYTAIGDVVNVAARLVGRAEGVEVIEILAEKKS